MKPTTKILLSRGVEEVIGQEELEKGLKSKRKLRVKHGIDPTASELHLGHAVSLRKLRQFQDAGHKAVFLIGDFTAMIGDPSEKESLRKQLTLAQVKKNMKTYLQQAGKIIDLKKAEVVYNSRWLKKLQLADILELLSKFSQSQLTARRDFAKRLKAGLEVAGHEQVYPVMQAYDSVMVKADLELGAYDQRLNMLAGRQLMEKMRMKPQAVLTTPLIEGTDGSKKMSKTSGNYIALEEGPKEMFGKIMSIPDKLMSRYFELLTDIDPIPLKIIKKEPRNAKLFLAKTIVGYLHDQKTATKAMIDFVRTFSEKKSPSDIPVVKIKKRQLPLIDLLVGIGVESKSEARRLIEQRGVRIDGQVKDDPRGRIKIKNNSELRIGKRKFFKLNT